MAIFEVSLRAESVDIRLPVNVNPNTNNQPKRAGIEYVPDLSPEPTWKSWGFAQVYQAEVPLGGVPILLLRQRVYGGFSPFSLDTETLLPVEGLLPDPENPGAIYNWAVLVDINEWVGPGELRLRWEE